ncbi:MAG: aldehyde dehydrogenase family protein [Blastocatellia bacterium]|nr:aldehyde dehydrogenase family protein [Blastocatellia bacterium]MBK6428139.1 aldehyde dehydrogenase family protein [Blastocatellia bacterium]
MNDILKELGLGAVNSGVYTDSWVEQPGGGELVSFNPATGEPIATVLMADVADYDRAVEAAERAFEVWRVMPAPKRGEVVRQIGNALREKKAALGALVSMECGKIRAEGEGEVQEMIDIADFAVGLSRQLYGLTIHSERPSHRMYEQWHPLGVVGVISAFNFPVAVWSWNALLAGVCGDSVVWKPSEETPLTAVATTKIVEPILRAHGVPGLFPLVVGGRDIGAAMANDRRIPLVSATGSCTMGRSVGEAVARRLGRSLLELGGNNAIIVLDDARLDLALRAVLFGAVGTAGQRCTSTRRVLLQKGIATEFTRRLVEAYESVSIGDPLADGTLMGPLVNERAVVSMMAAIELAKSQGGEVLYGGHRLNRPGYFVQPTIVRATSDMSVTHDETFAPIVYLIEVDSLDEAVRIQNGVPQGLSSAIFTDSMQSSEYFLSALGSDCGIANVNLGTSGAEIGGAFGGEKDTGGGRESGSDSWKAYMRRQTNTINYGNDLPLAQGITFGE